MSKLFCVVPDGNEVLRVLLMVKRDLHQLARGQMIGQPCLATLPFATDGIAHDVALVGISLDLNPSV